MNLENGIGSWIRNSLRKQEDDITKQVLMEKEVFGSQGTCDEEVSKENRIVMLF